MFRLVPLELPVQKNHALSEALVTEGWVKAIFDPTLRLLDVGRK